MIYSMALADMSTGGHSTNIEMFLPSVLIKVDGKKKAMDVNYDHLYYFCDENNQITPNTLHKPLLVWLTEMGFYDVSLCKNKSNTTIVYTMAAEHSSDFTIKVEWCSDMNNIFVPTYTDGKSFTGFRIPKDTTGCIQLILFSKPATSAYYKTTWFSDNLAPSLYKNFTVSLDTYMNWIRETLKS